MQASPYSLTIAIMLQRVRFVKNVLFCNIGTPKYHRYLEVL